MADNKRDREPKTLPETSKGGSDSGKTAIGSGGKDEPEIKKIVALAPGRSTLQF